MVESRQELITTGNPAKASFIVRLSETGVAGHHRGQESRQIILVNQLAMLGFSITLPYLLFFLYYDSLELLLLIACHLFFSIFYVLVLILNDRARYRLARNLGIVATCAHIFLICVLISAASGAHLFYIPLAGVMVLIYPHRNLFMLGVLMGAPMILCLLVQVFMPAETAILVLGETMLAVIYNLSIVLAVCTSAVVSFVFRAEIERAEGFSREIEEELTRLSKVDQLTRIANRRRLDEFLEQEWQRALRQQTPLSVLMIDIDLFKRFNDYYGHQAGDECLRRVAAQLTSSVSRSGDLVARYGGEEFMIVLPGTDRQGALNIGERVRRQIEEAAIPHADSQVAPVLTVSVGVASLVPNAENGFKDLLGLSDEALYQAKNSGRNRVCCVVDRELADPVPGKLGGAADA